MVSNNRLKSLLIFALFFTIFFAAHLSVKGFILFDDPYYHAKHSFLIEQTGSLTLVDDWLDFQFFNYAPTDPWWGFHLSEALFIHWFGLFYGVKIFISFLAATVFSLFYFILSNLKVKYAAVWTVLLFFVSTIFTARLLFERPHLLSMVFLPLVLWLLIKKKFVWLFVAAVFYTLFYQLAPLLLLPTIIFMAVDAYSNKQINLKPLIAVAGGILIGVLTHPYNLNYLYVMYISIIKIPFLKFAGVNIDIGGEMRLYNPFDFFQANYFALSLYLLAATLFLSSVRQGRRPVAEGFLFLYSGFWFLLTLIVQRGAEYWLPGAMLFVAVVSSNFLPTKEFLNFKEKAFKIINSRMIGAFLLVLLVVIASRNTFVAFGSLYNNQSGKIGADCEQANNWLKSRTEKNSVVFYDNWGMWPMMFFYNDHNHYIAGMDPTFFYEYDRPTYWLWRKISTEGLACDQPGPCARLSREEQAELVPETIKLVFRSKYIAAMNFSGSNLIKALDNLKAKVKLVFKNDSLLIYEIL